MQAILIIGIFLSFFMMLLLLSKRQKQLPDKILAVWMFFIGLHIIGLYLNFFGYWERYPHLVGTHHPLALVHGPFLYLYTLYSVKQYKSFRTKDLLHLLPFVLLYLAMIPFFALPASEKRLTDQAGSEDSAFGLIMVLSLIAIIVSGLLYPALSYRLINKGYNKLIDDNFAYHEKISLKWLQILIIGIFTVYFIVAVGSILIGVLNINMAFNTDYIVYSLFPLFLITLGYFGIRQEQIFSSQLQIAEKPESPKAEKEYQSSGLKTEDAKVIHKNLLQLMSDEKPFLEPKLSLGYLSEKLGVSANYLSQAINQCEEKNFYDFVNEYRVKEFIELSVQPENKRFNILALAFEAGFNSKSAFNQVFKKQTGKTPSEFMNELTV